VAHDSRIRMRLLHATLLLGGLLMPATVTAQEQAAPPEQKQDQPPTQPQGKAQPQIRNQVLNLANGNSFFDFCRAGTQQKQICIMYVKGVLDGAHVQASLTKQRQAYCQPRGATLEQALDILLKFMTDNPGDRHREVRLLAFAALKAAWPCPAGGGQAL
jgi:hypothetical protein